MLIAILALPWLMKNAGIAMRKPAEFLLHVVPSFQQQFFNASVSTLTKTMEVVFITIVNDVMPCLVSRIKAHDMLSAIP